jgi:hypothetical protein
LHGAGWISDEAATVTDAQWPRESRVSRGCAENAAMGTADLFQSPTIDAIRANRARLGDLVVTTPVRLLVDDALAMAAHG